MSRLEVLAEKYVKGVDKKSSGPAEKSLKSKRRYLITHQEVAFQVARMRSDDEAYLFALEKGLIGSDRLAMDDYFGIRSKPRIKLKF